jgi:hypothetical protein
MAFNLVREVGETRLRLAGVSLAAIERDALKRVRSVGKNVKRVGSIAC